MGGGRHPRLPLEQAVERRRRIARMRRHLLQRGRRRRGGDEGDGRLHRQPVARLPRSSRIDVEVKSVTPMDKDSAMVRFDTQRRDANGHAAPAQPWVAVLRFGYSGEAMSAADRIINPLGFKVTSYCKRAEAPPLAAPVSKIGSPAGQDRSG